MYFCAEGERDAAVIDGDPPTLLITYSKTRPREYDQVHALGLKLKKSDGLWSQGKEDMQCGDKKVGPRHKRATSHPRFAGRPEAMDWEDARNRLNLLEVIGRITITLVPAPGWLHGANEPSSWPARSLMPVIPKW